MAASVVAAQSGHTTSAVTSNTLTLSAGAGNALLVTVACNTKTRTVSSITDSAGNSGWVQIAGAGSSTSGNTFLWWNPSLAAAITTITVTYSGTTKISWGSLEVSGLQGTLDGSGVATNVSTAASTASQSVTTMNADDFLVAALSVPGTPTATGTTGVFTWQSGTQATGSGISCSMATVEETSTGTYTATFTLSASSIYTIVTAALKVASTAANVTGAAALTGTGSAAATGVRTVRGAAGLSGAGPLTAAGFQSVTDAAALSGTGSLAASGVVDGPVFFANDFDTGQTSGTAVSTGNSGGGTGNTPFDTVVGSPIYSSAQAHSGSLSVLTGSAATELRWTNAGELGGADFTELYLRAYAYFQSYPASNTVMLLGFDDANATVWRAAISSAGRIVVNISGTNTVTGTVNINQNAWVRIEAKLSVVAGVASIEMKLFNSPESATPDDTVSTSAAVASAFINQISYGPTSTGFTSNPPYLDDVAVASDAYIGPVPGGTEVTGAAALSGSGSLAVGGVRTTVGAAAFAGAGSIAAAGQRTTFGAAALTGTGSLSVVTAGPLVVAEYSGTPRFVLAATGQQILLRGANTIQSSSDTDRRATLLSLGCNMVRVVLNWHNLEPTAPSGSGTDFSAYSHTLDAAALSQLDTDLQFYADNGLYFQVDMHQASWSPYFGGSGVPSWYYTDARFKAQQNGGAGWNNSTDKSQAINNFWTDTTEKAMSQQLYIDVWRALIGHLLAQPYADHMVGYHVFNEPNPGNMGGTSASKVGNMHAWLAPVVDAIHTADPERAKFLMCRGGGQGYGTATFAEFTDLIAQKCVLEFHAYYVGLAPGRDASTAGDVGYQAPDNDDYFPDSNTVHTTTTGDTYTGSEVYQEAWNSVPLDKAAALGLPAFLGECGVHPDDTGRLDYIADVQAAIDAADLSATVWKLGRYPGDSLGLLDSSGALLDTGSAWQSWFEATTFVLGNDVTGAADLVGAGSASAAGFRSAFGAASLSGLGSLSASAHQAVSAAAALAGAGSLDATGVRARLAAAALTGTGALTVSGHQDAAGAAALTALGALAASGRVTRRRYEDIVWAVVGLGITKIQAEDAGIAAAFFDNAHTYATGNIAGTQNQVPAGYASIPTVPIDSYADFQADVAGTGTNIDPSIQCVMYDIEEWAATPLAEQNDPATYMASFASLAHANGYLMMATPAQDLMAVATAVCHAESGETNHAAFLRCAIPQHAAAVSDIYVIQSQALDSTPTTYQQFVQDAAAQAWAANPQCLILAEVTFRNGETTAGNVALIEAAHPYVDGFYVSFATDTQAQIDAVTDMLRELSSTASAALTGTGSLAASGVHEAVAAAPLTGIGTLSAVGTRTVLGSAALGGAGSLAAGGVRTRTAAAALSGAGTLASGGRQDVHSAAHLTGAGSLSANGSTSAGVLGQAHLTGTGTLASAGVHEARAAAHLTGTGSSTTTGVRTRLAAAALAGTGTATITGARTRLAGANLAGAGSLTASGRASLFSAAHLTGTGSLAASFVASAHPIFTRYTRATPNTNGISRSDGRGGTTRATSRKELTKV